jgi:hypothetical protein
VLRHDDADTGFAGEGVEHGDDACACCGVEVGQGLIHQEQGRMVHHCGGDGDERCLTRREGAEIPVQQRGHPDPLATSSTRALAVPDATPRSSRAREISSRTRVLAKAARGF